MDKTGVEIDASTKDAMNLNLQLRTAFHVLQRFADINCRNADELYSEAKRLPWDRVIDPNGFLSVTSNVRNETITNSMFPNMRLKDAICDKLVEQGGKPSRCWFKHRGHGREFALGRQQGKNLLEYDWQKIV